MTSNARLELHLTGIDALNRAKDGARARRANLLSMEVTQLLEQHQASATRTESRRPGQTAMVRAGRLALTIL